MTPRFLRAARALCLAVTALGLSAGARAEILEILNTFWDGQPGGTAPRGGVTAGPEGHLYGTSSAGGAAGGGTAWRYGARGLRVLHDFAGGADGAAPVGALREHRRALWGTTTRGGADDAGTLFRIEGPAGYQQLANFGAGMAHPSSGLGIGIDLAFYGTTTNGGGRDCDCGTVYRFDQHSNQLTRLHAFDGRDGAHPTATPAPFGGYVAGTAFEGGDATRFPQGAGTVWYVAPDGSEFTHRSARVGAGLSAGLTYDRTGRAFTVARDGGPRGGGGILEILNGGGETRFVHTFVSSDSRGGANPSTPLLLGRDGMLYGTTETGGLWPCWCGTVFRFNPDDGAFTTLHSFDGLDGHTPTGTIVQDDRGRLVGTTVRGGDPGDGTLWRLTPSAE